jgi:hypothetical protein
VHLGDSSRVAIVGGIRPARIVDVCGILGVPAGCSIWNSVLVLLRLGVGLVCCVCNTQIPADGGDVHPDRIGDLALGEVFGDVVATARSDYL